MRSKSIDSSRNKNSLNVNKLAIFLEIIIVFLPLYLGLVISDKCGANLILLGRDVVILGGPLVYLGLVISILLLWFFSWVRGASWGSYGVKRPASWFRTILISLVVALAILGTVVLLINPVLIALPNLQPRDMSHFAVLEGSLPNLLLNLVVMWITAGFLEEFLWRGYLLNRLIDLIGSQTKLAWVLAIFISAIIFGLGHGYQGTMGMLKTGAVGLVFGFAYLAVGRNLWPLVFAHALIDSIDFITHYLGG